MFMNGEFYETIGKERIFDARYHTLDRILFAERFCGTAYELFDEQKLGHAPRGLHLAFGYERGKLLYGQQFLRLARGDVGRRASCGASLPDELDAQKEDDLLGV